VPPVSGVRRRGLIGIFIGPVVLNQVQSRAWHECSQALHKLRFPGRFTRLRGALGRPGCGLLEGARHPRGRPDGRGRATLRIGSQHMASRLLRGVVGKAQVKAASAL
jgi:hypothetical protein